MRGIADSADCLRFRGPLGLLQALSLRLFPHSQRLLVLELVFAEFAPPPDRVTGYLPDLSIGPASEDHVAEIRDLLRRHRVWRRRREFEEVFRQQSSFLVATNGGRIVAYACATPSVPSTHQFARTITLGSRCAYGVHAFVDRRYRSRGVYPRLVGALIGDLRRKGYERMRLVCEPGNRVALSSHHRVGMKTIRELRVLRVAGLVFPRQLSRSAW